MLVDRGKTNRWLATQLGKDPASISKWCTNAAQPTLETMMQIAKQLNVEMNDLVRFEALPDIPSLEENVTTIEKKSVIIQIMPENALKGRQCILLKVKTCQ